MYTVHKVSQGQQTGIVRTVGKRIDLGVLASVSVDPAEASEGVLAVDVHGARAADTFTTGSAEGESRVHLVLDLDESVEHLDNIRQLCVLQHAYTRTNHRARLVEINLVRLECGLLLGLLRVL